MKALLSCKTLLVKKMMSNKFYYLEQIKIFKKELMIIEMIINSY